MVPLSEMIWLDNKDFLPEQTENWIVINKKTGEEIKIIGDTIPKNKLIANISSGYTHYFRTEEGLKKFSAFIYTIKKV